MMTAAMMSLVFVVMGWEGTLDFNFFRVVVLGRGFWPQLAGFGRSSFW